MRREAFCGEFESGLLTGIIAVGMDAPLSGGEMHNPSGLGQSNSKRTAPSRDEGVNNIWILLATGCGEGDRDADYGILCRGLPG